jgi:glucose/arabinose dehydrogenase
MLSLTTCVALFVISGQVGASTFQPKGAPFRSPVTLAPGVEASVLFSNLTTPRGIAFDAEANLLVVERGFGITAFKRTQTPSDGVSRSIVISNPNFTQGIQVDGSNLYASTAGQALLFEYDGKTMTVTGSGQVIIDGIPPDGVSLTSNPIQIDY